MIDYNALQEFEVEVNPVQTENELRVNMTARVVGIDGGPVFHAVEGFWEGDYSYRLQYAGGIDPVLLVEAATRLESGDSVHLRMTGFIGVMNLMGFVDVRYF